MIVKRNLKLLAMIPILIYYAIKRFNESHSKPLSLLNFKKFIKKVIAILCLLAFTSNYGSNPKAPLIFNIIKNNNVIGSIKITENISRDSVTYTIESQVETKLILTFKVVGKEKYIYRDGTLGKAKVDLETVSLKLNELLNKKYNGESSAYFDGRSALYLDNRIYVPSDGMYKFWKTTNSFRIYCWINYRHK